MRHIVIGGGAVGGTIGGRPPAAGRDTALAAYAPGALDVGRGPDGVDDLTEQVAADLIAAGVGSRADPSIMAAKYRTLRGNLGNAADAAWGGDDPDLPALCRAARNATSGTA